MVSPQLDVTIPPLIATTLLLVVDIIVLSHTGTVVRLLSGLKTLTLQDVIMKSSLLNHLTKMLSLKLTLARVLPSPETWELAILPLIMAVARMTLLQSALPLLLDHNATIPKFVAAGGFRTNHHHLLLDPEIHIHQHAGHRADRPRQFDVGAFRKANLLKAIDEEDLGTIKELYRSGDSRKEITDHVVEAKSSEFILKFAEIIRYGKWYLFSSLFRKKSNAVIEQVLEKSDFSQEDLIDAARDVELVCLPQRFVHLLSKIESMRDKVKVIVDGVIQLFTKERTECIEPLLTELESKQFLSKDLANFATQVIFVAGVFEDNEICTKSLYDRPAITPEVYAYALSVTAHKTVKSPLSGWLLVAANRDDLLALKKWGNHGALNTEFQKASDTVKLGESRHCAIVGPIVEAVNEVTSGLVPESVASIICSYVTENEGSSKSKRKRIREHQYMLESIMERIQSDERRRLVQTTAQDQSQELRSRRRRGRRQSPEEHIYVA